MGKTASSNLRKKKLSFSLNQFVHVYAGLPTHLHKKMCLFGRFVQDSSSWLLSGYKQLHVILNMFLQKGQLLLVRALKLLVPDDWTELISHPIALYRDPSTHHLDR